MPSNSRRRAITPQDPRLNQLAGMRDAGFNQADMARAIKASQQTVSRLLHYLDSLSAEQSAKVAREREPNELAQMIADEAKRRALRDQAYEAYQAGEIELAEELSAQAAGI